MNRKRILIFSLFFFSVSGNPAIGQSLEDFVSSYTGDNGNGYMQPLANAFGANINSGLYHTAYIPEDKFRISFNLVGMIAFIGDDNKTFKGTTPEFFIPQQDTDAPTIFGDPLPVSVFGNGGTEYSFPGGLNIDRMPLVIPQLTIGTYMGTQGIIRYFAIEVGENFGNINLWGLGVRHSVSQYFDDLPMDLAAGVYYHSFDVADLVEASAFIFTVQSSYTTSNATFYGGLGVESSSMDITYNAGTDDVPDEVKYNLDAENSVRLTLGLSFALGAMNIFTDYNLGAQNVWSFGIGF